MPTIYETLSPEVRARIRVSDLDADAQRIMSLPVPRNWTPERTARIAAAVSAAVPIAAARETQRRATEAGTIRTTPEGRIAPPATRAGNLLERMADRAMRALPDAGFRSTSEAVDALDITSPRHAEAWAAVRARQKAGDGIPENPHVAPPTNFPERAADVVGGVAGFTTTAATLAPILGPLSIGAAAAAPAGTDKERVVRGGVAQVAGTAGHAAGKVVSEAIGGVAGRAAATLPSALAFGSAAPVAESAIMRTDIPGIGLHGDKDYPMPRWQDLVQGGLEMAAVNLMLGARGIAGKRGAKAPASAVERPQMLSLPAGRVPEQEPIRDPRRRLPPSTSSAEVIEAGPGSSPGAPAPASVGRQLPSGPAPSGPAIALPQRLDRGDWVARRFPGAIEKLAPEFAGDSRRLGQSTVADLFRAAVAKRLGNVEPTLATRADVKAAVRDVLASGEMRGYQEIADAVNEPRGVHATTEQRASEARFSKLLSQRVAGREVVLNLPGGPARATLVAVQSFRYPGVADPIRVIAADPGTGELRVLRYGSLADLTQAVGSPQAMLKAEDVFARSERERARRAAPAAGTSRGTPVAGPEQAAIPAPAPTPKASPAAPAEGRSVSPRPDLFAGPGESVAQPAEPAKPEPPAEAVTPAPEKPRPAAKAEKPSARPRVEVDMDFRDSAAAQRLADDMNKKNPDFEARVEVKGKRVIVTANNDAKEPEPVPAKPKPEPPKRPTEPSPPVAEEVRAEEPAPAVDAGGVGIAERPAEPPAAEEPAPTTKKGRRDFERGEGVSVPNQGRGKAARVHGKVVGYLTDSSGRRTLQVDVRRGEKGFITTEVHNPDNVRRLPRKAYGPEAVAERAKRRDALLPKLRERTGGTLAGAARVVAESERMHDERRAAANDLPHPDALTGAERDEAKNARNRAMRGVAAADLQHEAARHLQRQMAVEHFGEDQAHRAMQAPEYADEWIAAKTKHGGKLSDTPENRHRYLRAVEGNVVGHPAEARELLRYAAERADGNFGDALPALRGIRWLEQNRVAAEAAAAEGMPDVFGGDAEAEAGVRKALDTFGPADIDAELTRHIGEPSPADDIPAGTTPIVPEGFGDAVRSLHPEAGKVNLDMLLPHLWIRELRDIGRKMLGLRRGVPAKERSVPVVDARGNVVGRWAHDLYNPDDYSHSAMTRFFAHATKLEPGAHVLTYQLRDHYKAAISHQAWAEGRGMLGWKTALGEASNIVAPFSSASKMFADALEGRLAEDKLPPALRGKAQAVCEMYLKRLREINALRERLGMDPISSRFEGKYVGPHLILGRVSEAMDRTFAEILGERGPTPEVREMRNRFLAERTGDPEYVRDAALQFVEWNRAMSRYESMLEFWDVARKQLREMETNDPRRGEAIINWMKSSLMQKKSPLDRMFQSASNAVLFAKGHVDVHEVSLGSAADIAGIDLATAQKKGWGRAFVVHGDPDRVRAGGNATKTEIGRTKRGDRVFVTEGAHLFSEPEIRPSVEALARKRARLSVARDLMMERGAKRLGSKTGEFLDPSFTPEQHAKMREAEWRWRVVRGQYNAMDALFKGIGNNQSRALLGYNVRSMLNNSMQMYLTMAPEIGLRRTTGAVVRQLSRPAAHAVSRMLEARGLISADHAEKIRQGFPIGRRTAQMIGALQGEVQRTGELTAEERSALKTVHDALGPMSGFKAAEDFSRGVAMLGASYVANRMGYPAEVASRFAKEGTPEFFEEWRERNEAQRKVGTRENLYATLDTEWMFDYNALGRAPIFGGTAGSLFGRMMTFPGRYARRYVTRPLGATAKVGEAIVRGEANRALNRVTGDAFPEAFKPKRGPSYGLYPAPKSEFDKWLDEYGAHYHDRQGAKAFFGQVKMLGLMAGVGMVSNLNTALIGTPGWQQVPLMLLLSMLPPGSKHRKTVKDIMQSFERSSVIDPNRGVEGTMSPTVRAIYSGAEGGKEAYRRAMAEADRGNTAGVVREMSAPALESMREMGRTSIIPGLIALRRSLQQMPHAERFFETGHGRAVAHLLGIKSYIRGNGVVQSILGNFGLRNVSEEERNRVKVDRPARRGPPSPRRQRRSSPYSALVGPQPTGAA